jgi:hypothetical protein
VTHTHALFADQSQSILDNLMEYCARAERAMRYPTPARSGTAPAPWHNRSLRQVSGAMHCSTFTNPRTRSVSLPWQSPSFGEDAPLSGSRWIAGCCGSWVRARQGGAFAPKLSDGQAPSTCVTIRAARRQATIPAGQRFWSQGTQYRSLSTIARKIPGTAWSGPLFLGLKQNRSASRLSKASLPVCGTMEGSHAVD